GAAPPPPPGAARPPPAAGVYWITFDVFAIIGPTVGGLAAEYLGARWVLVGAIAMLLVGLGQASYAWLVTRRIR
ncbi:hypothetical protein ABZU75_44530, partial [Streptosporangium sp. NPDC005286]|uniref:hypothetical protein n=1 Tax=Streptosporangium sp. NPDC005286 TaxID=3154463 RepID=UPI0033BA3512